MSHDTTHSESHLPETAAGLELNEPRVITMTFGARAYTWTFRRIVREDWERFFRSLEVESLNLQGESVETFDTDTGVEELARECVIRVDGYRMADVADFRRTLPHGHLLAFGRALRDVGAVQPPDDEPIALTELIEVRLDCTWSHVPGGAGWKQMVHRFHPPTLAQQRAYNRACNTYRVIGDARAGKTIYPARQTLMIDFYDELVHSVDACYHVHGRPLADRAEIVREMDACHKVAAIQGLLQAGGNGRLDRMPAKEHGAQ